MCSTKNRDRRCRRHDRATLPRAAQADAGRVPRAGVGQEARRLLRLLHPARPRRGRRPEVEGAAARPAAGARLRGGGAGRAERGGPQRRGRRPPARRPARGYADLGASADADQRRTPTDHSERHRIAAARHLQPQPRLRRYVVRPHADRGVGRGHGLAARRLRPGARGRRLHLRRHRDGALRGEARHREGVPRRDGGWRARRRRRHSGVGAEPLLPPERRRVARSGREERRRGADGPAERHPHRPPGGRRPRGARPVIDEHDVEQLVRDILDAREAIRDAS